MSCSDEPNPLKHNRFSRGLAGCLEGRLLEQALIGPSPLFGLWTQASMSSAPNSNHALLNRSLAGIAMVAAIRTTPTEAPIQCAVW